MFFSLTLRLQQLKATKKGGGVQWSIPPWDALHQLAVRPLMAQGSKSDPLQTADDRRLPDIPLGFRVYIYIYIYIYIFIYRVQGLRLEVKLFEAQDFGFLRILDQGPGSGPGKALPWARECAEPEGLIKI